MIQCDYCPREFKNPGGYATHAPYCKENPNRVARPRSPNAHAKKGFVPWNKGKTGLQTSWKKGKTGLQGHQHRDETKKRLSQVAKDRGLGGYVPGSGRGKKGWYRGVHCDSSWELAFLIYKLDHGSQVIRCTERRSYTFEGKNATYIPDFVVDGKIVEIKGYKTDRWLAKLAANPDINTLYEEDMIPILNYVVDKYGKNFVSLYE